MKINSSRRKFLQTSALAVSGITLLSSASVVNTLCKEESPYVGYNPFAEEKTDLRTSVFGNHIQIEGIVYDKTGNTPLTNALIEVWHLSPNSTKYRHRAKLKTNSNGEYRFITDFPQREPAKTPKILFKISHQSKIYFTELAVDHSGAYITSTHWEQSQELGEKLFPVTTKYSNNSNINFNLLIN